MDHQRLAGRHAQKVDAPIARLDRHRQGGRVGEIEPVRNRSPKAQDGVVGQAGARIGAEIGGAQDAVADTNIAHALADGVHGSRHIETDPAREFGGEQAPAQGPIGGVEAAGVHPHADVARMGARNGGVLKAEHVGGLAMLVEADRPHGVGGHHRELVASVTDI